MPQNKKIAVIILFMNLLVVVPFLYASPISDTIMEWRGKINMWQNYYYLALSTVIAVAVLGALSGILQKSVKQAIKQIAMVCAFSITLITVVTNAVEMKGHKDISKAIVNAERILSQLESWNKRSKLKEGDIEYQFLIIDEVAKLTSELSWDSRIDQL